MVRQIASPKGDKENRMAYKRVLSRREKEARHLRWMTFMVWVQVAVVVAFGVIAIVVFKL